MTMKNKLTALDKIEYAERQIKKTEIKETEIMTTKKIHIKVAGTPPSARAFPKLMIHKTSGHIFLFARDQIGTAILNPYALGYVSYPLGTIVHGIYMEEYEDLPKGFTITLEQE